MRMLLCSLLPALLGLQDKAGTRTYAELAEDFLNPERGLIVFAKVHETPSFDRLRERGHTVVYSGVLLSEFRAKPIDGAFLERMERGFDAVRAAGLKVILRFSYSSRGSEPDAPLEQVLKHIVQLKPLLQKHADVIAVVQAGFIGPWGEWHSSTNGLDADEPRRQILTALLDAVPASRMIQVRTPMFKKRLFGAPPLSEAEAFRNSPRARIAHHNDAFLSDETDHGTYDRPVETWKEWLSQDAKYGPYAAETFAVKTPAPEVFEKECERLGASFMHLRYDKAGLEAWEKSGFLGKIRRRLGYRLVLVDASATPALKPGGELKVSFTIRNDGFAPPFNPRPLQAVLTNGKTRLAAELKSVDVRRWAPGKPIKVSFRLAVPASTPAGKYRLGLALPDDAPSIAARPDYAIRFANAGTWDAAAGENVLFDEIRIDALAPGLAGSSAKELVEIR